MKFSDFAKLAAIYNDTQFFTSFPAFYPGVPDKRLSIRRKASL
jgi:hypothetical protein